MCLHNSVKERISVSNLELLDTYDTSSCETLYSDNRDYIELEDCKDIYHNTHDLSVIEINIRGLVNKQYELLYLLQSITQMKQVDVVILIETWLTKDSEGKLKLPGYEYVGLPRCHKKGGGVGFLIQRDLKYKHRFDLHVTSEVIENCFIELLGVKRNIIKGALYRAPNLSTSKFVADYELICKNLNREKNKDSILGLDHNLDLLKHHLHKQTQKFMECMLENSHFPCITCPTRVTNSSATLIDNLLLSVNLIGKQNSSVIVSDVSDHLPCLTLIRNCMITQSPEHEGYKWQFTEKYVKKISDELFNIDWNCLLTNKNTMESLELLYNRLGVIIDKEAPEKTVRVSTGQALTLSWMTPGLLRSSNKQLKLYKKALISGN